MSREIKFRVWDNVDYMSSPFTLHQLMFSEMEFTTDCPVMQFTGLKDMNGKEIYEDDIIYNKNDFSCICGYGRFTDEVPDKRQVRYDSNDCAYKLYHVDKRISDKSGSGYCFCKENCEKLFEVIGNIYQNPELIQK